MVSLPPTSFAGRVAPDRSGTDSSSEREVTDCLGALMDPSTIDSTLHCMAARRYDTGPCLLRTAAATRRATAGLGTVMAEMDFAAEICAAGTNQRHASVAETAPRSFDAASPRSQIMVRP
jgi:hypothetical protein